MNSENLHSATFLQESAVGLLPCKLPGGLQLDLFGQDHALASLSVLPAKEKALTITVTSGLSSAALLRTANLQQSLENRLHQQMDVNGSPEYALTWKTWDMESGPPICALRASQRRISDKDYTGWPTPRTVTGGAESAERKQELGRTKSGGGGPNPLGNVGEHFTLQTEAVLAGWVTPSSRDYKDTPGMSLAGTNPDGTTRMRIDQLPRQAAIAGQTTLSFHVGTAKRGVLNPDLPRWLMGYPEGWGSYADTVTRFVRK